MQVLQCPGSKRIVLSESGIARVGPPTARWHQVGLKKPSRTAETLKNRGLLDVDLRFSRGAHEARRLTMTSETLLGNPQLECLEHTMNRLRVRTTVFGGAALGLIAGAAVFGAVSSSSAASPAPFKPALVSVDTAPALTAASCAAGQKLEHGVCIVHVEKVVVVPAPASVQAQGSAEGSSQDISSADDDATEISDDATKISDDATETSDDAEEAAHEVSEHASDAGELESDDSAELESDDHS